MFPRGRRIAFDYGDSRIGVAISDPDGILATPHATLQTKNPALIKELKVLFAEIEPVHIFIGLPKLMSGEDGAAVAKAESFAEKLASITNVTLSFVDERLSTVSAAQQLRDSGKSAQQSKKIIDAAAAVAILEQGLRMTRSMEDKQ